MIPCYSLSRKGSLTQLLPWVWICYQDRRRAGMTGPDSLVLVQDRDLAGWPRSHF